MWTDSGGYRRDHLRALAQRVEIDAHEFRIMGSKSVLLRTPIGASSARTAGCGISRFVKGGRAPGGEDRDHSVAVPPGPGGAGVARLMLFGTAAPAARG